MTPKEIADRESQKYSGPFFVWLFTTVLAVYITGYVWTLTGWFIAPSCVLLSVVCMLSGFMCAVQLGLAVLVLVNAELDARRKVQQRELDEALQDFKDALSGGTDAQEE